MSLYQFNSNLREIAIQKEYSKEYFNNCRAIGFSIEESLEFGVWEGVEGRLDDPLTEETMSAVHYDAIEMKRLYVASFIDHVTRTSIKKGLSAGIAESLKRSAFTEIIQANGHEQLRQITVETTRYMIRLTQRQIKSNYSGLVTKTVNLIQQERYMDIKPSSLAAELNVNRTYLSDLFSKEVGMTLTDYIRQIKIHTAAYILEQQTHTLEEIAELLSFNSYSYFSKVFKRVMGKSPRQYLAQIHE